MPFIGTYKEAMEILSDIEKGTCKKSCKTTWMRNLKYALQTKTNPLSLNKRQRKTMSNTIKRISTRKKFTTKNRKTLKKYKTRKSPPYPANKNCNKIMIGNDGNKYISKPNKNNVCSWRKIK